MPSLIVTSGALAGQVFGFTDTAVVGRGQFSEVRLNDPTVSRRHAEVRRAEGGRFMLADVGSLNGTWVDGAIVSKAVLRDGSTIQIGTFRMVFHTNARRRINTEG